MPPGWNQLLARWEAEAVMIACGPTPRPGILDIAPYVGGEATAPGALRPIRLASNESALGPSALSFDARRIGRRAPGAVASPPT